MPGPIMSRVWAMPNKWTFEVPPLIKIIRRYKKPGQVWADPFAGHNSPAEFTNDLNTASPALFHLEAQEFVLQMLDIVGQVDGAIFDPPYSLTQVSRSYQNMGLQFKGSENPTGGFPKVRDGLSRLVRRGGIVISYGWNTVGMGKKRGFEPIEYLICSHGGNRNDTLVTVEIKL
jgi:hypothetical protein